MTVKLKTTAKPIAYTEQEAAWIKAQIAAHTIEDGDCLVWQRCLGRSGGPTVGRPAALGKGSNWKLRIFVLQEIVKAPRPNPSSARGEYFPLVTCGNPKCLCEDHLKWASRAETSRSAMERTGRNTSLTFRANVAKARAHRNKLSPEQVGIIRTSDYAPSVLAAQMGVSKQAISNIRTGRNHINYQTPWVQLMR